MNSKTGKKEDKQTLICNREKRDSFIKQYGEKEFEKICKEDENWAKLQDKPIPPEYSWLVTHFLALWKYCEHDFNGNKVLGTAQIISYCECFEIDFTIREKKLLLAMKLWANEIIKDLDKA